MLQPIVQSDSTSRQYQTKQGDSTRGVAPGARFACLNVFNTTGDGHEMNCKRDVGEGWW